MKSKILFKTVSSVVSVLCILQSNVHAGGKNLPLEERVQYYKTKAASAENDKDKKRYEKKRHQAAAELEFIESFLETAKEELDELKGVTALKMSSVKQKPTFTLKHNPNDTDLRREIDWSDKERYLQRGDLFKKAGGVFQILEDLTLTDEEVNSMDGACEYAIGKFGKRLEDLSGMPMAKIKRMTLGWGINYFVDRYFDTVEKPENGDLIVYSGGEYPYAGICRVGEDGSLLVENWAKMYKNNSVFLNPPFFAPKFIGKKAQVFRLKTQVDAQPEIPGALLLGTFREDGTFVFDGNATTKALRKKITESKSVQETCQIPELHCVTNIKQIDNAYDFAMGVIFGTYDRPDHIPYYDLDREQLFAMFENDFDITKTPEKGDLVLYYAADPDQVKSLKPSHYGVYQGNNLVLSKFRNCAVFVHPAWLVDTYADTDFIRYLRMIEAPEVTLQKVQTDYQNARANDIRAQRLFM